MSIRTLTLIVVLAIAGAGQVEASSFIVHMYQNGPAVFAWGRGSFDLTKLYFYGYTSLQGGVQPDSRTILTGPGTDFDSQLYWNFSLQSEFGTGDGENASSGSGTEVGVVGIDGIFIVLPIGYISDTPLISFSTWDEATLSSLGVTPGTYTWRWGSGDDAGTYTLYAGVPVPEPSQYGCFIALAVAGLVVLRRFASRAA